MFHSKEPLAKPTGSFIRQEQTMKEGKDANQEIEHHPRRRCFDCVGGSIPRTDEIPTGTDRIDRRAGNLRRGLDAIDWRGTVAGPESGIRAEASSTNQGPERPGVAERSPKNRTFNGS